MRLLLHSRPLTSGTLVRFEVREERLLQCIGTPPGVAGEKRNKLRSLKPQSTSRRIVLHESLCTHNWSRWTGRLRRYTMRTPPRAKHRSTRVYTCNGYSLYLCGICKPVQTPAAPYLSLVAGAGGRFESARRLSRIALGNPNTLIERGPVLFTGCLLTPLR